MRGRREKGGGWEEEGRRGEDERKKGRREGGGVEKDEEEEGRNYFSEQVKWEGEGVKWGGIKKGDHHSHHQVVSLHVLSSLLPLSERVCAY